jgi:hypothetical protein
LYPFTAKTDTRTPTKESVVRAGIPTAPRAEEE